MFIVFIREGDLSFFIYKTIMKDKNISESLLGSLLAVFGTGKIISLVWKLYKATKDPELKRIVNDTHSSNKVVAQRAKTILQKYYKDDKYKKYFKK